MAKYDYDLIARKSGLSRVYIYQILKGKRTFRIKTGYKIAKAMGITFEALIEIMERARG